MDNQNPTPNPAPPSENIPAQNPAVETSPQVYTAPHLDNAPPPPPKPFMFSKVILLFLIIIILLLGASGTYFALNSKPKPASTISKATPIPIPTPTIDETANWKTYNAANFSFKYPPNFKLNSKEIIELSDENGNSFLLIFSFNPAVVGISYCNTYPNDKARCEQLEVGDKTSTIDWGVDGKANAMLKNLSITLNKTDTQAKMLFRQILSTFKFTDQDGAIGCTQEAKLCPDGSYVGRSGPNCEFVCPE